MKLRYKGIMNGFFRLPNGEGFNVERGQIYDVPDNFADSLIKSTSWERPEEIKAEVKEDKKINRVFNKHSVKNKTEE
jgi:hypothetical protein